MSRIGRLFRYRLLIPVLRGKHMPEHTARGVLVGLLAALTPTVGVQMPIVFVIWLAVRAIRPSWDFNLIVGMAWTWVTNIFTVPPFYYVFLVTGRIMMGRWDEAGGYGDFQDRLSGLLATDAGPLETLWIYVVGIFDLWGVPMFIGSIPWAILGSWIGYRWSLRMIRGFHLRRMQKELSRR